MGKKDNKSKKTAFIVQPESESTEGKVDERGSKKPSLGDESIVVVVEAGAQLGIALSEVAGYDPEIISPAVRQISLSADEYGVPPTLLAAVIHQESSFNHEAVSSVGAVGLSQIMPRVWASFCRKLNTFNGNIACGAKVLRHYYEQGGSWEKALVLYNVGPGNYQRSEKMRQTGRNYARRVLNDHQRLEQQIAALESL